jgi:predicted  nucleic acid-binding Zn-ribbon protein
MQIERIKSEMDRKLPSLESEISELKSDLKSARANYTEIQSQLVKQTQAFEQVKEKKDKY